MLAPNSDTSPELFIPDDSITSYESTVNKQDRIIYPRFGNQQMVASQSGKNPNSYIKYITYGYKLELAIFQEEEKWTRHDPLPK
jgi:5-formaminoimidazole-4-carboxamide-1-beta-D-ribofuranosyl 5'-monophosphate synthetase